jgi:hypothetical protein
VRLRILKFLWRHARWLAASKNSLRVNFDNKLAAWRVSQGDANSLVDGRRKKKGVAKAPPIPKEDIDAVIAYATFACGGRVAQGVRELGEMGQRSGLTESTLDLINREHASKSYVNARLRGPAVRGANLIGPYLLGKRAIDDATPSLKRDHSKLHSMAVITMDDLTPPVYFWMPDGQGWYLLTRGQCLAVVDCRSLRVLGFSLQPERNYNSLVIRTLDNQTCRQFGIPRVKLLERGMWKTSKVVKNAAPIGWNDARSWEEHDFGWEKLGVKIIHATKAQTKPVELVFGLAQNLMERVPGYCGRDERRDCPEETRKNILAVQARRVEPHGLFLDFESWIEQLGALFRKYNASKQDGEILAGLSPDEAFEKYWPHDDPPTPFDAAHWHLFAHYVSERKVTHEGIAFRIGKEQFVYRGESTKGLIGEKVLAWFDPGCPEILGVTDLNSRNPILVERRKDVGFLAALDPESEEGKVYRHEVEKASQHASQARAEYRVLKTKFNATFRHAIVPPSIAQVGEVFKGREQLIEKGKEKEKRRRSILTKARKLKVPASVVGDDDQSLDALDMMEEARREHARETQPKEHNPNVGL